MKATTRPFKSKYTSGRCPRCKRRILADDLIVRLDKTVTWIAQQRLIPHGRGRFFTDLKSSQYAHAKCMDKHEREQIPLEDH